MKKIAKKLKKSDNIAVFVHTNPDGDAVGSIVAFSTALKNMGKNVDVKLFGTIDGLKEFTARLSGHNEENIILEIDGKEKSFPKNKISSIRLTVEF